MADEDDIRELIGRLSASQRQGFHVTPAAIRLIVPALRLYAVARGLVERPSRDPLDDASHKHAAAPAGPPATIGSLRGHGLLAVTITCDGLPCHNVRRVLFNELGLDDAVPFPDIGRLRGFRCRKFG